MRQEEFVARICHACWCAYQLGAEQIYHEKPTEQDLASQADGLRAFLAHPFMTAAENHDNWMKCRLAAGWVYGPVRDTDAKTHPDLVPFDKLPIVEQNKDSMDLEARRFALALYEACAPA